MGDPNCLLAVRSHSMGLRKLAGSNGLRGDPQPLPRISRDFSVRAYLGITKDNRPGLQSVHATASAQTLRCIEQDDSQW
jgi:hypothetical protein